MFFLSKCWYMCDVLIERRGLIIWPWVYLLHNDVRAHWLMGLIILHWRIIHSGPCKSVQDPNIFLWRFSVFSKDKVWTYLYDFRIYTAAYQWWAILKFLLYVSCLNKIEPYINIYMPVLKVTRFRLNYMYISPKGQSRKRVSPKSPSPCKK